MPLLTTSKESIKSSFSNNDVLFSKLSQCEKCCSLFEPGINCRIKSKKKSKLAKTKRNLSKRYESAMEYTCLICNHKSLQIYSRAKIARNKPPKLIKFQTTKIIAPTPQSKDVKQNRKKKAIEENNRKKSMNSIKSLLEENKEKEKRMSSLDSFLSSLN